MKTSQLWTVRHRLAPPASTRLPLLHSAALPDPACPTTTPRRLVPTHPLLLPRPTRPPPSRRAPWPTRPAPAHSRSTAPTRSTSFRPSSASACTTPSTGVRPPSSPLPPGRAPAHTPTCARRGALLCADVGERDRPRRRARGRRRHVRQHAPDRVHLPRPQAPPAPARARDRPRVPARRRVQVRRLSLSWTVDALGGTVS